MGRAYRHGMELLIVLLVIFAVGALAVAVGRDTRPVDLGELDRSLVGWHPQTER
jgi:hypothetical protein